MRPLCPKFATLDTARIAHSAVGMKASQSTRSMPTCAPGCTGAFGRRMKKTAMQAKLQRTEMQKVMRVHGMVHASSSSYRYGFFPGPYLTTTHAAQPIPMMPTMTRTMRMPIFHCQCASAAFSLSRRVWGSAVMAGVGAVGWVAGRVAGVWVWGCVVGCDCCWCTDCAVCECADRAVTGRAGTAGVCSGET